MLKNVKANLNNSIFKDRLRVDKDYLMSLDLRALLQNYTVEAGVILEGNQITPDPSNTYLHWGWESPTCQLRGHFLGHWMSACAHILAVEKDRQLEARLYEVIDKLAYYQELSDDGWVGPIPEKYFYILRHTDRYIWSPQYTMHKLFLGLVDVYDLLSYKPALNILSKLSDWYVKWVRENDKVCPEATLLGETGGMLEIWARLYMITGQKKYLDLAHAYEKSGILSALDKGEDPLTGNHTNASIPWAHGTAAMFIATKDKKYLDLTKKFWKCAVNDREQYATGGQNAGEFWIPKGKLGEYMGDRNQEFCTMYNMVRLADYLYKFTGDKEYLDFIEINIYNGFLAQQNPQTGMPTYFLPMKSASKKVWGSKTHDFWCCHGTMIQSQTLYSELAFYEEDESIVVGQYIPSKLSFGTKGNTVTVSLLADMNSTQVDSLFEEKGGERSGSWSFILDIEAEKEKELTIKLRIPGWIKGEPYVLIDKKKRKVTKKEIESGFVIITGKFKKNVINIAFEAPLYVLTLPDRKDLGAVMEGPKVLASVGESAVLEDDPENCLIPKTERVYQTYPWMYGHYLLPQNGADKEFMPLYEIVDEEYSIYQKIRE
ncbi:MAG: glycoside hydrolase family 127 protein [Lachnospiraceae bacterium]|nr:glycoside hydrolase family 127 protein [Lachnospiraceae bacterium]